MKPEPTPFTHRNGADRYRELLERLGGTERTPKLEACRYCGHPCWRNRDHAHAACTAAAGGTPTPPVHPDTLPDPVVGLVYASITSDPEAAQVSDATAARLAEAARRRVDAAPRCRVCGGPLTLGQRGVHHTCDTTDDTHHEQESL